MVYSTLKRKAKRFFYENGHKIAFYTIEEESKSWLELSGCEGPVFRAVIRLDKGKFENDSDSLGIHGTDFEKFGVNRIKEFLCHHFDAELGELMFDCLAFDLTSSSLMGNEKVRFT